MPETTERTPLQIALAQACEFARAHGGETPITPEDFGIQRSESGWQHATYIDADHALSVTIEPDGRRTAARPRRRSTTKATRTASRATTASRTGSAPTSTFSADRSSTSTCPVTPRRR